MTITHLNPKGLHSSPASTQAVAVTGPATLVFVGGQNGVDSNGEVVAAETGSQTRQALRNVELAVEAAGD